MTYFFLLDKKTQRSKQKSVSHSLNLDILHWTVCKIKRNTSMRFANSCYKKLQNKKCKLRATLPFLVQSSQGQMPLLVSCESFQTYKITYISVFLSLFLFFNTKKVTLLYRVIYFAFSFDIFWESFLNCKVNISF